MDVLRRDVMSKSDSFFVAANIYIAASLAGKQAAWWLGLFCAAVMFYYIFKEG